MLNERIDQILEQSWDETVNHRKKIIEKWNPYIATVNEYTKSNRGSDLTEMESWTIAQVCENCVAQATAGQHSMFETATTANNISFLGVQLNIISALLPSLVLNDIAVVQPLDRRIGAVFYMDVKAGTTKGSVTAADTLISSKTGYARTEAARNYAMNRVTETMSAAAPADALVSKTVSGKLNKESCILGSVSITDGTNSETANDAAIPGQLAKADGTVLGWVKDDGTFSITFSDAPDSVGVVTATYSYYYDKVVDAYGNVDVPEVYIDMSSSSVTAIDFPLKTQFSVGAAIDYQKAWGMNLETELVKYLGGMIKFEQDHYGIDQMLAAAKSTGGANAGTASATWSPYVGSGNEWFWVRYEFLDKVEQANIDIVNTTLRAAGNFLVVSNNEARVIKQLGKDHFSPVSGLGTVAQTGPYKMGVLDGRTVIHDPFQTAGTWFMGYKGPSPLMAGFIYAPYIPMFMTPTVTLGNLMTQKGFMSSCGYKTVNAGMYAYGTTDLSGLASL